VQQQTTTTNLGGRSKFYGTENDLFGVSIKKCFSLAFP